MDTKFKVIIEGDTSDLEKNFDSVEVKITSLENNLKRFQNALKKATDPQEIQYLTRNVGILEGRLNALKFDNVTRGSGQAANAMTNLSRVAQDLPFGFIGIQNNLNPLLESFQRLKVETGRTGGAMKALLGQLTGAGGLGLALSAVSAAVTFATVGFGAWSKILGESGKKAKEAADAQDQIIKGYAEEITQVRLLISKLKDEHTTKTERINAIKELKRINPEYFGQLNAEKSSVEQVTKAYNEFNNSIQSALKAKIYTKQLEPLIEQELKLKDALGFQNQYLEYQKQISKGARDFISPAKEKAQEAVNKSNAELNKNLAQQEVLMKKIDALKTKTVSNDPGNGGKERTLEDILKDLKKTRDYLNASADSLGLDKTADEINAIESALKEIFKIGKGSDPIVTALFGDIQKLDQQAALKYLNENLPKFVAKSKEGLKPVEVPVEVVPLPYVNLSADDAKTAAAFEKLRRDIILKKLQKNGVKSVNYNGIEIKITPTVATEVLELGLKNLNGKLQNFTDAANSTIANLGVGIAEAMGEGIGNAISGGGFGSLFKGLFSVLGDALLQLGKLCLGVAIGLKAIKKAFSTLNPGVALAAGIGLIALGTVVKSQAGKIPKFAKGGMVTGQQLAMVGDNPSGKEAIIPFERMGEFLGQFGGGGGSNINVSGEFRMRGDELYAVMQRVDRRMGRTIGKSSFVNNQRSTTAGGGSSSSGPKY